MKFQKTLTIIIACILFLTAKGLIAEGQADIENDKTFGPKSAELLIQHINNTFGATAAGNEMVGMDMEMKKELDRLNFSYQGQRQKPQYRKLTALDYRKASFGSNH